MEFRQHENRGLAGSLMLAVDFIDEALLDALRSRPVSELLTLLLEPEIDVREQRERLLQCRLQIVGINGRLMVRGGCVSGR